MGKLFVTTVTCLLLLVGSGSTAASTNPGQLEGGTVSQAPSSQSGSITLARPYYRRRHPDYYDLPPRTYELRPHIRMRFERGQRCRTIRVLRRDRYGNVRAVPERFCRPGHYR